MTVCTIISTGCRWPNHNHQAQRLFGKNEPNMDLNAWFGGQLLMSYWLQSLLCLLREAGPSDLEIGRKQHQAALQPLVRTEAPWARDAPTLPLLPSSRDHSLSENKSENPEISKEAFTTFIIGRHFQSLCHRCECFIIFVLLLLSLIFFKKSTFEIQFVYF